jgi:hypothetical protein
VAVSPSAIPAGAPEPLESIAPPEGEAPAPSAFPSTTMLAVGGLAAVGLIAFLALR